MIENDIKQILMSVDRIELKILQLEQHLIPEKTDVSKESEAVDRQLKKGSEPRKYKKIIIKEGDTVL